jgi:hypothetical protein
MDPTEAQNIQQYQQLFGHAPPAATPQNLQLAQALQAAKARAPAAAPVMVPPHATPGVSGAIKDAVKAIAGATAPKAITQQPARLAAQEAASQ